MGDTRPLKYKYIPVEKLAEAAWVGDEPESYRLYAKDTHGSLLEDATFTRFLRRCATTLLQSILRFVPCCYFCGGTAYAAVLTEDPVEDPANACIDFKGHHYQLCYFHMMVWGIGKANVDDCRKYPVRRNLQETTVLQRLPPLEAVITPEKDVMFRHRETSWIEVNGEWVPYSHKHWCMHPPQAYRFTEFNFKEGVSYRRERLAPQVAAFHYRLTLCCRRRKSSVVNPAFKDTLLDTASPVLWHKKEPADWIRIHAYEVGTYMRSVLIDDNMHLIYRFMNGRFVCVGKEEGCTCTDDNEPDLFLHRPGWRLAYELGSTRTDKLWKDYLAVYLQAYVWVVDVEFL